MAIAPSLNQPFKKWRVEEKEAPRAEKTKPPITGDEAKVYATLKSDTIMVILIHTDSHAVQGERASHVHEKYFNLNGKLRRFKAISVYFSRHTKMVGGDYSQEEKAHT